MEYGKELVIHRMMGGEIYHLSLDDILLFVVGLSEDIGYYLDSNTYIFYWSCSICGCCSWTAFIKIVTKGNKLIV
jgi:hypothetical protein